MSIALKPKPGATPPGTKRPLAASPGTFLIWGGMALFLLLLIVGYVYAWRKGAFDWAS